MSEAKENVNILCQIKDPLEKDGTFIFYEDGTYTNGPDYQSMSHWKIEDGQFFWMHPLIDPQKWFSPKDMNSEKIRTRETLRCSIFKEHIELALAMREMLDDK